MNHPCAAFGVTLSRGRQQRPGKAGPALDAAQKAVNDGDLMLVVGISGVVYPVAGLAHAAHRRGARVVVINPDATELEAVADLCLHKPAAQCLPTLLED